MKYIQKLKKNKILLLVFTVAVIFFVFGIFFIAFLSNDNQKLVQSSIGEYFKSFSNYNSYRKSFLGCLSNYLLPNILIWLLGISIIGIPIILLFLVLKSFIVGFSFTSILYTYGIKGILLGIVYIVPHFVGLFITFILSYYSIQFSLLLWNYLFRKKEYNKNDIVKRYLKLLFISMVFLVIISWFEAYVIPLFLKSLIIS